MIQCDIHCFIPVERFEETEQAVRAFSEAVEIYAFSVILTRGSDGNKSDTVITITVDDEKIKAMKGAKRGPKEKSTRISTEEMLALKKAGRHSQEIADLAGISIATYFRKMAALSGQQDQNSSYQEASHEIH